MRKSRCAEAVTLTGTAIADVAKTVTVEVAGGTATVADDFAAVADFTITIPAGMGSASGTFDLTPVADSADEGDETVAVGGTAAQGETDLPVDGTTVTIANVVRHDLTVAAPSNGRITGSGIDCGGTRTDCAATFADNVSVTLEASPEAGYALDEWTDDCSGRGDCGLVMDADRTVGATFGTARKLTVTAPANGKITGGIGTEEVIDCGSDCTETVADGTAVALEAEPASDYGFSSWGGACAAESSSACSVTLNADRTVSVAFVANPVDGRCDESTVDGCADGTLNTTAHSDTKADHHWRCDGQHGGANSDRCTKAKAGCTGGSQDWTAGSNSCSASVGAVTSGQTATATDRTAGLTGSATFKCDDGSWVEQSGSSCERECRTTSHTWRVGSATCSARIDTLQSGWSDLAEDETYRDTGTARYACDDGTWTGPRSASCRLGCAGETKDNCVLTNTVHDGSSGSCASGSNTCSYTCANGEWSRSSNSCAPLPECGATEAVCLSGDATNTTDSLSPLEDRWTCTSGGVVENCTATPAACGANAEHALNPSNELMCVCKSGYQLHNGVCAPLPECGSTELSCDQGDATNTADSLDPLEERWQCTGAGVVEDCDATPAACPSNASHVLVSSELACVCDSGYRRDGGVCKELHTVTVVVTHESTQTGGRVTGSGFNCTATCSQQFEDGTDISLSGSANSGYKCGFDENDDATSYGSNVTDDETVNVTCDTTLEVDPGGTDGDYTATHTFGTLPFGGTFSIYTAKVSASAKGGISPYTFRWEDQTTDSDTAIYVFAIADTYEKDVTATDSATPNGESKEATADIYAGTSPPGSSAGGAGGAQGASEELAPFEVPLGGELRIIWGEDSAITASSGDEAVVGVSVASPEIRVTGAGLGTAEVIVQTDSGELRLPVVVK